MIKEWWTEETTKLKGLSPAKRVKYIWQYYKLWIIGILALIYLTVFLIVRISNNVPDCRLYVVYANTMADVGNESEFWQAFVDAQGYDLREARVEFDAQSYFDYTKNQARGNSYYNAFIGLADAGMIDIITMECDSIKALGQCGRLIDLRSDLTASLYEAYADRLLYYEPEGGEPIPVGFDVSDSILITKYHIYPDSCGLAIITETNNIEDIAVFLSYILQEQKGNE
ncbi:MAG: hypothetical protein IJ744_05180 [Lachnospiraceae bacterium]|nr:hypothetical protein [Lachnospiraceae bacterium]